MQNKKRLCTRVWSVSWAWHSLPPSFSLSLPLSLSDSSIFCSQEKGEGAGQTETQGAEKRQVLLNLGVCGQQRIPVYGSIWPKGSSAICREEGTL